MIKNYLLFFVFVISLHVGLCQQHSADNSKISITGLGVPGNDPDIFNLHFDSPISGSNNTWMILNDDFKMEMDTVDKVQGKNSLKFSKTYLPTEYEMFLFQKIFLPQPGKAIKLSLYSKCDQLEAAWFKVTGFNKKMETVVTDSIAIKSEAKWKEFSAKLLYDDQIYMISLDIRARETFKTKKSVVSFWLDNISIKIDDKSITALLTKPIELNANEINEINHNSPLNSQLEIPLDQLTRISNKKVIGFGETVHGSKEIHQAIFNNIRQLISNFNCRLVLLEIPIETGLLLNQFVNDDVITDLQLDTIVSGFAVDTQIFCDFMKWVKYFNKSAENKVLIFGLNDYINQDRPRTINKFILNKHLDSELLDSFLMIINKTYLRSKHLKFAENNADRLAALIGTKEYHMLIQNLKIRTDTLCRLSPTWHEWEYLHRDYLMWQNAKFAIEQLADPNTMVALWAHFEHLNKNTPIMNDQFNSLGQYLTSWFKNDYYLIGFLVGSGEISTWASNWKARVTKNLGTPPGHSMEFLCNHSNTGNFLKSVSDVSDNSCMIRNIGAILHENSQFKALPIKGSMDEYVFIKKSTGANIPILNSNKKKTP